MYHINNEGKIYPCRARVLACPYGPDMHSRNKEELYNIILRQDFGEVPIPKKIIKEMHTIGRIKNLYRMSEDIENNKHPIETIIQGLNFAINNQEKIDLDQLKKRHGRYYFSLSDSVYNVMKRGLIDKLPSWIPTEIRNRAFEQHKASPSINGDYIENTLTDKQLLAKLDVYEELTEDYIEYKKFRLTKEIYDDNMRWLKEDLYQFSHDLNTSKILTQPIFYGNLKKARQTITSLNNQELLSAYDDYLVSDEEILENVRLANKFIWENREDLTDKANGKVKNWYDMNRTLSESWEKNRAKRVLLSMELAKELDKREIAHQDRRRRY